MAANTRLVVVATASTLLTAACIAVLAVFVDVGPFSLSYHAILDESGSAAVISVALTLAFFPVAALLVLALPFGVAAYRIRAARDDILGPVAWLIAALAVLPGALLAWLYYDATGAAVTGLVALAALVVAIALAADPVAAVRSSPAQFAHVGLAVLLVAGLFAGAVAGNVVQRDLVVVGDPAPQATFEVTYDSRAEGRAVVTVTHTGGDPVPARELDVRGMRFANVSGVDQTHVGPWQGETSGPGGQIVEGDSVTIGVDGDCRVRLVYVGGNQATLADATCTELR